MIMSHNCLVCEQALGEGGGEGEGQVTYFFIVVSRVLVKLIAPALLTSISIPPNFFTAS